MLVSYFPQRELSLLFFIVFVLPVGCSGSFKNRGARLLHKDAELPSIGLSKAPPPLGVGRFLICSPAARLSPGENIPC